MGKGYATIAFTPAVQAEQDRIGSRGRFAEMARTGRDDSRLGEPERAFLASRESFYLSSVGASGWPYMQHRGGPGGFLQVSPDGSALAFADLSGNRQHVSIGNLAESDRVALFFMDYAGQHRLKLLGHARALPPAEAPDWAQALATPPRGKVEHVMLVTVAGWEWNCSQHIPRLIPLADIEAGVRQLADRVAALEAENAALRGA